MLANGMHCAHSTTQRQSTLLKALAGRLKHDAGHIKKGSITVRSLFSPRLGKNTLQKNVNMGVR